MAGFVHRLSSGYDEAKKNWRAEVEQYRQNFTTRSEHKRTSDIVGKLLLGFDYFLAYTQLIDVLTEDEAEALFEEARKVLDEVVWNQRTHQAANEPAQSFIELLAAALASGRAHLATRQGDHPPNGEAWGWRHEITGEDIREREKWRAQGERIGWIEGNDLYLNPTVALAIAQRLARDQGDALVVTTLTLHKRLYEKGYLVSIDKLRRTLTIRKTVEGKSLPVLHLDTKRFTPPKLQRVKNADRTDAIGTRS